MKAIVRRAKSSDAAQIINAHVTSIREICSKDYKAEQIRAWAGRDFSTEVWRQRIADSWVWVVEIDDFVEGVGWLRKMSPELCYMDALYLTPRATGKKLATKIMEEEFALARTENFKTMQLNATLTALGFYEKFGFKKVPEDKGFVIFGQSKIEAIAMELAL